MPFQQNPLPSAYTPGRYYTKVYRAREGGGGREEGREEVEGTTIIPLLTLYVVTDTSPNFHPTLLG